MGSAFPTCFKHGYSEKNITNTLKLCTSVSLLLVKQRLLGTGLLKHLVKTQTYTQM